MVWNSVKVYACMYLEPETVRLAKAREYVLPAYSRVLGLCVYVFVTTITIKIVDRFVPNCMERFLGKGVDQVRVSLRSVGCGSNGQKTP